MAEEDIGSFVMMDGEEPISIMTEGRYSRNIILKGETSPTTLVRDIMERNIIHVRPEQSIELCMALMTEKHVRHLPVLEGKNDGIISIGDLLKAIISKQKYFVDELNTTFTVSAYRRRRDGCLGGGGDTCSISASGQKQTCAAH